MQKQEFAAKDLREAQSIISKDLTTAEARARGQVAKALAAIRTKIDEILGKKLDAADQLRAVELQVEKAVIDRETACRTRADEERKKTLAQLNDKQTNDGKLVYNYSGITLAGTPKRRSDKRKADLQLAYVSAYNDCMGGVTGEGAGGAGAIKLAEKQLKGAQDGYANVIAKLDADLAREKQELEDLDKDKSDEVARLEREADKQMTSASSAFDKLMASTNLTIAQKTREVADLAQDADAEIGAATKNGQQYGQAYQSALVKVGICEGEIKPKSCNPLKEECGGLEEITRLNDWKPGQVPASAPAKAAPSGGSLGVHGG